MPEKQSDLPLWLGLCAMALLTLAPPPRRERARPGTMASRTKNSRPFGERRSSEEPDQVALRRAREHGRGRHPGPEGGDGPPA